MSQAPKKPAHELAKKAEDTVLIHGVSRDGETLAVLRAREERIEAGLMRTVKEGTPVEGEVVRLTPRPEFPLLCDVKVEVPAGTINARGAGEGASDARGAGEGAPRLGRPAQVATARYRDNWDAIWSKGDKKPLPN